MRFSKKIGFRGLIHEFHRELFQTYFVIETDNKGLKRTKMAYGTVSAKIAPRLKCYKNASRLNRYNLPTDNAIDFLFSTFHSEMV